MHPADMQTLSPLDLEIAVAIPAYSFQQSCSPCISKLLMEFMREIVTVSTPRNARYSRALNYIYHYPASTRLIRSAFTYGLSD